MGLQYSSRLTVMEYPPTYPSVIPNIEIVMTYTFNRPAFPATRMRRIRKMTSCVRWSAKHSSRPITWFIQYLYYQDKIKPKIFQVCQTFSVCRQIYYWKKLKDFWNWAYPNWLFSPVTPQEDKSLTAEAAWREDGLVQTTCRLLKKNYQKWY